MNTKRWNRSGWTLACFVLAVFTVGFTDDPIVRAESIVQEQSSGPIDIRVTLKPESPRIGDTLTLSMEVIAEEDVEVLMPDFGEALDRFTIADFAPRQTVDDEGRNVFKQTYRLDAPSSGRQVIPPILFEYVDRREGQQQAPEGLDAYEVLTDRIVFEVASVLPDNAAADLKPPLPELSPIEPPTPSKWPWILVACILVAASAYPLWKTWIAAQKRARRRSAFDVAQTRLEKLLKTPRSHSSEIPPFYVGLTGILRQYIEDRYDVRAPELTTEEFLASMGQSPDFSNDHQGLLRQFLKQADLVKFARAEPTSDETDRAIDAVKQFLTETRENAPLLDEESDSATVLENEAIDEPTSSAKENASV